MSLYSNRRLTPVAAVGFSLMIRQQNAIDDREFVKYMIPHHAGAIQCVSVLPSAIPRPKASERGSRQGQQAEIDFMNAKPKQLDTK